jgi:mono/diheme cytochrome c family protein
VSATSAERTPRRRRVALIGASAVLVLVLAAIFLVTGPGPFDFIRGKPVALMRYRGADPTGVPAALAQASVIERGQYLATAADCVVCHTAPGGKPYAGGFAFQLPFGTLYSTNITPDSATGIGAYTDAEFLAAMHRGMRRDGAHLYPAMPFTSYGYMTDADALAIKAYLFSLAPVNAPAKPNDLAFPFNQRWAMGIWSALFNPDRRFTPVPQQSAEWNRGAYLAEALAHCGECHTPRNLAFALNNRKKFGGAVTAGWRAYNISGDAPTGVGSWHDDELFNYLALGHALGHGTAAGPMGEAVDESFSRLTTADVRAVVAYLRSVPPVSSADLPATLAPAASASHMQGASAANSLGKSIYEGACVSCHGWSGESPVSPYATLTGARAVNDPKAINVAQIVISGMKRTTPAGITQMPGFGDAYSDAEIAAVANFVTDRFGAARSSLSEHDIAKLRQQTAQ